MLSGVVSAPTGLSGLARWRSAVGGPSAGHPFFLVVSRMSAHNGFAFFLWMPVPLWIGVIAAVASVNFWHLPLYHSVFIGNAAGIVCWLLLVTLPDYFFRSG